VSQTLWDRVDGYIAERLIGDDPALDAALLASAEAGLPAIAVSPPQGKLLQLLARVHGTRRILEVGTLGGYSTIWLARALPPDGRLITLELKPEYAAVAAANVERAGLAGLIEIRVGPALDSLRALQAEPPEPFDLVFIDADKQSTPDYFTVALELTRPGGVIVVDNVVLDGALIDPNSSDPRVHGMRRLHELLAAGSLHGQRFDATTIQTVGSKGHDGLTLVLLQATA
jgi:predicted O-methyltransferase YrrM